MLWDTVKNSLSTSLSESEYSLWIRPLSCIQEDDKVLKISCPDRFFCAWVKERYLGIIETNLKTITHNPPAVSLTVSTAAPAPQQEANGSGQLRLPGMDTFKSTVRSLHPAYTFEQFMVGESNMLARSACNAIASADYTFGNNLFMTSGTGLGKSHLTQAVVHQVMQSAPGTRMHYLTAQQFSAEMVKNLRSNSMQQFSQRFIHGCDLLLVEDVHTLAGKTKTQEELNNVLDYLIKSGKRVIMTSAVPARDIKGLDEDFRSRMTSGLITDIEAPEYKTRVSIIRHKAAHSKLSLQEEHVHFLADKLQGDIRRIESALMGIKAKASMYNAPPDMNIVRSVLEGFGELQQQMQLNGRAIRDVISSQYKISVDELTSRSRKRAVSFPRQIAMYLTRKYTEESLADIGNLYNRDHSTVLYAIKVINRDIAQKNTVRQQVEMLKDKLQK
ncbi:MAG: chromosomal replication initiator protein DnaA [Candidatus Electrothrix aestuarii]|uniref:Chromosomal replication initiator protein DnaA n=1 Tax=Candidatus Electrothrix aestuarii TaxID=3062594 RepID=A0AAU8LXG6_9BACT|nr:chromosomal replication initiator protein DnaA [Candidatus Electrothrix aestuarii]